MNRLLRDVRLIPIVLFATISLLVLKVSGLVFDGGRRSPKGCRCNTRPG